jgi:hypothetical protein
LSSSSTTLWQTLLNHILNFCVIHHKLDGYQHEHIGPCKFTPVFLLCTSILDVCLLFLQFTCPKNLFSLVQNIYSIAFFTAIITNNRLIIQCSSFLSSCLPYCQMP